MLLKMHSHTGFKPPPPNPFSLPKIKKKRCTATNELQASQKKKKKKETNAGGAKACSHDD